MIKRALVILLVIVIGVPLIAYGVGLFVPRDHVASMTIDFEKASTAQVWKLITDFGNTPKWRSDVTGVRVSAQADGKTRFTESTSQGDVEFEVLEQSPGKQVVKVVDDNQPFGGTWTWLVAPRPGGGTSVRITEVGFIKNPIFRTMGIIFFSPTDTMDGYLRSLAKALGENAEPKISG
jgi:uncharacterized protein YndB with AHSA1/START domain